MSTKSLRKTLDKGLRGRRSETLVRNVSAASQPHRSSSQVIGDIVSLPIRGRLAVVKWIFPHSHQLLQTQLSTVILSSGLTIRCCRLVVGFNLTALGRSAADLWPVWNDLAASTCDSIWAACSGCTSVCVRWHHIAAEDVLTCKSQRVRSASHSSQLIPDRVLLLIISRAPLANRRRRFRASRLFQRVSVRGIGGHRRRFDHNALMFRDAIGQSRSLDGLRPAGGAVSQEQEFGPGRPGICCSSHLAPRLLRGALPNRVQHPIPGSHARSPIRNAPATPPIWPSVCRRLRTRCYPSW